MNLPSCVNFRMWPSCRRRCRRSRRCPCCRRSGHGSRRATDSPDRPGRPSAQQVARPGRTRGPAAPLQHSPVCCVCCAALGRVELVRTMDDPDVILGVHPQADRLALIQAVRQRFREGRIDFEPRRHHGAGRLRLGRLCEPGPGRRRAASSGEELAPMRTFRFMSSPVACPTGPGRTSARACRGASHRCRRCPGRRWRSLPTRGTAPDTGRRPRSAHLGQRVALEDADLLVHAIGDEHVALLRVVRERDVPDRSGRVQRHAEAAGETPPACPSR